MLIPSVSFILVFSYMVSSCALTCKAVAKNSIKFNPHAHIHLGKVFVCHISN